ncbi:MAG: hypothetical protein ABDH23_01300 [Endomicrobiia bacterium]
MKRLFFTIAFLGYSIYSFNFFEEILIIKPTASSAGISACMNLNDPVSNIVVNPANIHSEKSIISASYYSILNNMVSNFSFSFLSKTSKNSFLWKNLKINNLGVSVFYNLTEVTDTSNLEFYDMDSDGIKDPQEEVIYDKDKLFNVVNSNFFSCISFSRKLKDISFGFSLKYLLSKLHNNSSYSISTDIALSYKIKKLSFTGKLNNILNSSILWNTGLKEKIQPSYEVGVANLFRLSRDLACLLAFDFGSFFGGCYSLGAELKFKEKYSLRGGISKVSVSNTYSSDFVSVGLGMVLKENLILDYATKFSSYFTGNIHFFNLMYSF